MKKLVYIFVFAALTSVSGFAQEINWVTLEKAMELQRKNQKNYDGRLYQLVRAL